MACISSRHQRPISVLDGVPSSQLPNPEGSGGTELVDRSSVSLCFSLSLPFKTNKPRQESTLGHRPLESLQWLVCPKPRVRQVAVEEMLLELTQGLSTVVRPRLKAAESPLPARDPPRDLVSCPPSDTIRTFMMKIIMIH